MQALADGPAAADEADESEDNASNDDVGSGSDGDSEMAAPSEENSMDNATTLVLGQNEADGDGDVGRLSDLDGVAMSDSASDSESSDAAPACSNGVRYVDDTFDSPGSFHSDSEDGQAAAVAPALRKGEKFALCEAYYRDKVPCANPPNCKRCEGLLRVYGDVCTPPPKYAMPAKIDTSKSEEKLPKPTRNATCQSRVGKDKTLYNIQ